MPEGYGVPKDDEGMLPWSYATELLEQARNYWVASVRPDGRPHVSPIWGAWYEGAFYFEGSPETRRGRNIAANPEIAVHIEKGDEVVILEGAVEEVTEPSYDLCSRLAETFETKYKYRPDVEMWQGGGLYVLRPRVAFAWGEFPKTVTRWHFSVE